MHLAIFILVPSQPPTSFKLTPLPASQLPGSYHQSLPDMEEPLQDLNCSTKRKVLVHQQQI